MYLYLVQHGKPKEKEEDPERPLSVDGVTDVNRVASFISGMKPARIFHSGKLRAAQTAEIFGGQLDVVIEKVDGLAPMDDPAAWAGRAREASEDTMLVGHLPHLGKLTSLLLCGDTEAGLVEFRQGCVLCLKKGEGRFSVQWMVVPELLG